MAVAQYPLAAFRGQWFEVFADGIELVAHIDRDALDLCARPIVKWCLGAPRSALIKLRADAEAALAASEAK